jgi:hypothetical protein
MVEWGESKKSKTEVHHHRWGHGASFKCFEQDPLPSPTPPRVTMSTVHFDPWNVNRADVCPFQAEALENQSSICNTCPALQQGGASSARVGVGKGGGAVPDRVPCQPMLEVNKKQVFEALNH